MYIDQPMLPHGVGSTTSGAYAPLPPGLVIKPSHVMQPTSGHIPTATDARANLSVSAYHGSSHLYGQYEYAQGQIDSSSEQTRAGNMLYSRYAVHSRNPGLILASPVENEMKSKADELDPVSPASTGELQPMIRSGSIQQRRVTIRAIHIS